MKEIYWILACWASSIRSKYSAENIECTFFVSFSQKITRRFREKEESKRHRQTWNAAEDGEQAPRVKAHTRRLELKCKRYNSPCQA